MDNHHDEHANSKITITPIFNNIGTDEIRIIKIMIEMSNFCAKF